MTNKVELWPGGPKRAPRKKYDRPPYPNRTMGQDGVGGSAPVNPPDVPEVKTTDIEAYAKIANIEVEKRGRKWWYRAADGEWLTGAATNYLMLEYLKEIREEREAKKKPKQASSRFAVRHEDWKRIATELFGEDTGEWTFECPSCGHHQSLKSVLEHDPSLDPHEVLSWIHFSCEGRRVEGHGCDWTLGGLLKIHRVDVYLTHVGRPTMMFAHPDAEQRLREVAYQPPQPEPITAETWEEYEWPEWVPTEVRDQVESFWSHSWGRGPRGWYQNTLQQKAPPLGTTVTLPCLGSHDLQATGRFVHAWNNIGRVVHEDGTFAYVSF